MRPLLVPAATIMKTVVPIGRTLFLGVASVSLAFVSLFIAFCFAFIN